ANGGIASDSFDLVVNSVNDAPTISDIANTSTDEDVAKTVTFTVGDIETLATALTLTATSSDESVVPAANIVFGGTGADRNATLTPALNAFGTATITITVHDANGGIASDSFDLVVNSVNDAPTISDIANTSTDEDVAKTVTFTVGDIETLATALTLTATSSDESVVPVANIVFGGTGADRNATITPALNAFGTATITITVHDANGGIASDSFDLVVNSVNDAPTISDIANTSTDEDVAKTVTFTVGDIETLATALTLTATSSDESVVPAANIVFGGTGADRNATITPAVNAFGTATITVTVHDANGGVASDSFELVVNSVNDAPTITDIANTSTDEDVAKTVTFTVGDIETPAGALTLTATSSDESLVPVANVVFGGTGADRNATITTALNAFGTATITITVHDANGGVASDSFDLAVNSVNDAPTISDIANTSTDEDVAKVVTFTVDDIETPAGALTLTATSSDESLVPVANIVFGGTGADRNATITAVLNAFGTATITITVHDANGGIVSDSFDLVVNSVNDAPTISDIANTSTDEDVAKTVTFTVGDIETPAGALTLTATSSDESLVPVANIVFGGTGADRNA